MIEIPTKLWTINLWEYIWTGSLIPEIATTNQKKPVKYKNKKLRRFASEFVLSCHFERDECKYAKFHLIAKKWNFNTETKTYFSNHTVKQCTFLNNFLIVYVKFQHIVDEKCIQNF